MTTKMQMVALTETVAFEFLLFLCYKLIDRER
jgi:hypothetical protein